MVVVTFLKVIENYEEPYNKATPTIGKEEEENGCSFRDYQIE